MIDLRINKTESITNKKPKQQSSEKKNNTKSTETFSTILHKELNKE